MVRHQLGNKPLIGALAACVEQTSRSQARRFLTGLSSDELRFIAEFLGACIVESPDDFKRAVEAVHLHDFRMARASLRRSDHEHKMILLREFLGRMGRQMRPDAGPAEAA